MPDPTTTTPAQVAAAWSVHPAADLHAAWHASAAAHLQLVLFDDQYHALPRDVWAAICQESHTRDLAYVRSTFDCNSFADALKGVVKARWAINGIAFVADISGKHAFNAVLVAAGSGRLELAFVEPQRDAFIVPQSKPCYDLTQGLAIF